MTPLPRLQEHRHPSDLPNHIDFIRQSKRIRRLLRARMRLNQESVACHGAPTANITPTVLQKINRAIKFIYPTRRSNFSAIFINCHQRSGVQYRIHGPIFETDKTISELPQIESTQETE